MFIYFNAKVDKFFMPYKFFVLKYDNKRIRD